MFARPRLKVPTISLRTFLITLFVCFHVCWSTAIASSSGAPKNSNCDYYTELLLPPASRKTNQSFVNGVGNTSALPWDFQYVDSSLQCTNDLGTDWQSYRQCKESEISLAFYTKTSFPVGTIYSLPYIRLNMSATMLEPANSVWFVYSCLQAPLTGDNYCHNKTAHQLGRYGTYVLPCREVQLVSDSKSEIASGQERNLAPFRADVLCFMLFSLSQYQVDVIVRPQNCRSTVYVTMPDERKFDPHIHQYYELKHNTSAAATDYAEWSPFLFVETHPEDGVWVRVESPPAMARVLEIKFALYKQQLDGNAIQFVREEVVRLPNTGFKWTDLDNNTYTIFAYVQRYHCRLICSDPAKIENLNDTQSHQDPTCSICPHTMLNFTINEPKFTAAWSRTRTLLTVVKVFGVSVLVLLLIVAFGLISVVGYLRFLRPRRHARRPPQNFELVAQPKVLILYTDDCYEHSECVQQLAKFLVENASARVHIDLWDLNDPSVRATNWLVNKLASADFVLLVFSAGSRRVMEGERMQERRPYPDLFNPALRLIVSKITSIVSRSSALDTHQGQTLTNGHHQNGHLLNGVSTNNTKELLKQFVVLRFNYSPRDAVAEFFPLMGCKSYQIPDDLPRLVAHLHRVETDHNSLLEFAADHQPLNDAILAFQDFKRQNPSYLNERFSTNLPHQAGVDQLTGAVMADPDLPEHGTRTDQEMQQLINRYGLENGHEEENNLAGNVAGQVQNNHQVNRQIEEAYPLVEANDISSSDDDNG